jgi:hypothetical protein
MINGELRGKIDRIGDDFRSFKDLHHSGLYGIFDPVQASTIIYIIDSINNNALCPEACATDAA